MVHLFFWGDMLFGGGFYLALFRSLSLPLFLSLGGLAVLFVPISLFLSIIKVRLVGRWSGLAWSGLVWSGVCWSGALVCLLWSGLVCLARSALPCSASGCSCKADRTIPNQTIRASRPKHQTGPHHRQTRASEQTRPRQTRPDQSRQTRSDQTAPQADQRIRADQTQAAKK